MEHIRQAIERAQGLQGAGTIQAPPSAPAGPSLPAAPGTDSADAALRHAGAILLNSKHLEAHRLIAYDHNDLRSRSFDILRTQVLQSMHANNHHLLAVTSPAAGCGKTLTAINLALSIARHPEQSALLVDLDLQKPQVANCLDLPRQRGLVSVLEGQTPLAQAILEPRIGPYRLSVLPCERPITRSSDWMASAEMRQLLQELRRGRPPGIIILDLPPILAGDDVISLLPQIDCALFVVAVGISTTAEIKECTKYLETTPVVRTVVNKVAELGPVYY